MIIFFILRRIGRFADRLDCILLQYESNPENQGVGDKYLGIEEFRNLGIEELKYANYPITIPRYPNS